MKIDIKYIDDNEEIIKNMQEFIKETEFFNKIPKSEKIQERHIDYLLEIISDINLFEHESKEYIKKQKLNKIIR